MPSHHPQNMIGVIIAVAANAVIPLALNLQKYAHVQNTDSEGKPRKPFTKIPTWWLGISLMIGGEFFNLLAFAYAPTALVAPVRLPRLLQRWVAGEQKHGTDHMRLSRKPPRRTGGSGRCLLQRHHHDYLAQGAFSKQEPHRIQNQKPSKSQNQNEN